MDTIKNRNDINKLVNSFYLKIRNDELLGNIFELHLANTWTEHLDKMTDFWETNLLGVAKFKGSPTQKHIQVDNNVNHIIEQKHFGRWLQLWFETIDELFIGEYAEKAKNSARKMSTVQFLAIWQNKHQNLLEEKSSLIFNQ